MLFGNSDAPGGFRMLSGYNRGFAYRAAAGASSIERAADDPRILFIHHLELASDLTATGLHASW